ncbi:MAG: hypothetical protein AAF092_03920 [Pseudomonadota bacterium]
MQFELKINLGQVIGFVAGVLLTSGSAALAFRLALDEIGDRVSDLENANVSIDYRSVASMLVEEHVDKLRGPAGNDGVSPSAQDVASYLAQDHSDLFSTPNEELDYEMLAQTIFKAFGEELRGPQGPPGQDGTAVDVAQLAAELALEFPEELKGPSGPMGPQGEPGQTPSIAAIAAAILEANGDKLIEEIVGSASLRIKSSASSPPDLGELSGRWVGRSTCGTGRSTTLAFMASAISPVELDIVDSEWPDRSAGKLFFDRMTDEGEAQVVYHSESSKYFGLRNGVTLVVLDKQRIARTESNCEVSLIKSGE